LLDGGIAAGQVAVLSGTAREGAFALDVDMRDASGQVVS
jgi:hypothetical protein